MSARRMLGLLACTLILGVGAAKALAADWETLQDEAGWIAYNADESYVAGKAYSFSKKVDIGDAKVKEAVL